MALEAAGATAEADTNEAVAVAEIEQKCSTRAFLCVL